MKTKFTYYAIIWAVAVALFNVILFVTPNEIGGISKFDNTFWISYAFIMLVFVIQIAVTWIALKDENSTKLFYNIPLFTTSLISLIVMLISGTTCMLIPHLPSWVGLIICLLALGFCIVALTGARAASTAATDIDAKIKTKTIFIKSLTVDVDSLISRANSDEMKNELKKLYDAVRYSDPMSNDALQGVESQITLKVSEIEDGVGRGDTAVVTQAVKDAMILINDRNKKCKLLK